MARFDIAATELSSDYIAWHESARRECLRDILQMTHLANSGHPGGSLSSLDLYLWIWAHANVDPQNPWMPSRDRVVVSHGHTSPGVYSVLAQLGFFDRMEAVSSFRRTGNYFEGHIEREVPGVEWTTGNLGQGLSAACGMALGARLNQHPCRVYVPMGDGEQQKGQIAEARRFIMKYGLHEITAVIDRNRLQIGGDCDDIMPQDIAAGWASDGWKVVEIDGHSLPEIHTALHEASIDSSTPHVVIANTIMGKGVSFMENRADFHGRALKADEYEAAVREIGGDPSLWDMQPLRQLREERRPSSLPKLPHREPDLLPGDPITYEVGQKSDNRGAFGKALASVAAANSTQNNGPAMAVFDCDLEGSVKVDAFHQAHRDRFFEAGIQEHHTAACAGALSAEGIATFFADFGVFGIAETYNQHRLTDINHGSLKLICTHIGLDVGEDGKTHQSIDYVGVLRNLFGMQIIVPADPNQTDRALRFLATQPGMFFLGMGRSKLDVLTDDEGKPFFGSDYQFEIGKGDWIRRGGGGVVVAMGTPTGRALTAVEKLRSDGLDVALAHLATPGNISSTFLEELSRHPWVVTVEDHSVNTGLGCCLAEALFAHGHAMPHLRIGVESYSPSGTAEDVYRAANIDSGSIERRVREFAGNPVPIRS